MNCLQADQWAQRALDGDLTAREREALDAHLLDCAGCRAAREEYRLLARTATVWARRPIHEADPGEAFTAQVMAQIAARTSAPAPAPVPVWQALAVAGLVLAALLACGLLFPLTQMHVSPVAADLMPRPQAALDLPVRLWDAARGLPSATARLWEALTANVTVSGTMVSLLFAALLLNGLLYARAVREGRGAPAR